MKVWFCSATSQNHKQILPRRKQLTQTASSTAQTVYRKTTSRFAEQMQMQFNSLSSLRRPDTRLNVPTALTAANKKSPPKTVVNQFLIRLKTLLMTRRPTQNRTWPNAGRLQTLRETRKARKMLSSRSISTLVHHSSNSLISTVMAKIIAKTSLLDGRATLQIQTNAPRSTQ